MLTCAVCGGAVEPVDHEFRIGNPERPSRVEKFRRGLYFHRADNVDFCGARCANGYGRSANAAGS